MQRVIRSRSDYRDTLLRNLLTSLLLYEVIQTTTAKAKLLVPFANRFYNRVKARDLAAHRLAHRVLFDKMAARKLFEEILPRYQKQETTFVSTFRLSPRLGDNAHQSLVSLIHHLKVGTKTDDANAQNDENKASLHKNKTKTNEKAKPRAKK